MLLRRVIEHVKAQNWTAVGIDFFIVVVGVFMGIQVNNWNQQRIDRELEQEYLERLLADVNDSIENTLVNRSFVTQNNSGAEHVLNSVLSCTLELDRRDEFANGLKQMAKMVPSTFALGTMEEMRATGNFTLLKNSQIRDKLNDLARIAAYDEMVFQLIYGATVQERSYIQSKVVYFHNGFVGNRVAAKWSEIKIDFDALCMDERFMAAVSHVITLNYSGMEFHDRAIAELQDVKSTLEAVLVD